MCQAQALAKVLQLKIMILLGKTSNYRRLSYTLIWLLVASHWQAAFC